MDIKLEFSFCLVYICMLNGITAKNLSIPGIGEQFKVVLSKNGKDPTVVGGNLTLTCKVPRFTPQRKRADNYFQWIAPNPIDHFRMHIHEIGDYMETLTIYYTIKSDSGTYACGIGDVYDSLDIQVNVNENFLIVETDSVTSITVSAGELEVIWAVRVKGYPNPDVNWLNNKNNVIRMGYGYKYCWMYIGDTASLYIKNIDFNDFGYFTFMATNSITIKKIFFLNVTGKPSGKPTAVLNVKPFYIINSVNTVKCDTFANPEPEIRWYFKPLDCCDYKPVNGTVTTSSGYRYTSAVTINVTESGYLICSVRNHEGNSTAMEKFYVSDVENGFHIYSLDKDVNINKEVVTITEGDTVTIICCASMYEYYGIQWFINGIPLKYSQAGYRIRNATTRLSSKIELELQHANITNSGFYTCRVIGNKGEIITLKKTFRVESEQVPKIINLSLKQDILFLKLRDKLELYCKCSGIPIPTLTWYKDGKSVQKTNYSFSENNEYLIISNTTLRDEGTYECKATNRLGSVTRQLTVQFLKSIDPQQTDYGWTGWLVSVVLGLVSIGVIIFIAIKIRKEKATKLIPVLTYYYNNLNF